MQQKILFQNKSRKEVFEFIKTNKQRKTLNFLNQHDLYQFSKNKNFRNSLLEKQNLNFIDGFVISAYLSAKNLKKISRTSGPIFTKNLLSNPNLSENKKHFFIGLEKDDAKKLQKKYPHLKKIFSYNPPYIKGLRFPPEEIKKISKLINKKNPDYVWIGLGCPKQNILSSELFKKTNAQYFMNVGAAIDFLIKKKKQAPPTIKKIGIEWLYRLITDFNHSRKKVWRSLMGIKYLPNVNN